MPALRNLLILDELTLTHRRGRAKFRVAAPYRLAWNYGTWSRQLTVPVGADTNGPSIIRETTADGRLDPAREAPACEGG